MNQKRIAIFGSTGSIGTQALDVIAANPDLFSAEILTAQTNDELLIKQALQFNPNLVVIGDERKYQTVKMLYPVPISRSLQVRKHWWKPQQWIVMI